MHMGPGVLGENLPDDKIRVKERINSLIDKMRTDAKEYNKKEKDNLSIIKEKSYNFILISGDRGSGKTSMILTIIRELEEENKNENKKSLSKNIILPIIDPSKFNSEGNALGWVIYSFEEKIRILKDKFNNPYYCNKNKLTELVSSYNELKKSYILSRPNYRNNSASLSDGSYEYEKLNEESTFSDMQLIDKFDKFIDRFIELIKNKDDDNEPLIFITFDDIDINPECGPEILKTMLNYLGHTNIVVFILGYIVTFKEEIIIDSLRREKIPVSIDIDRKIVDKSKWQKTVQSTEEFLEKVFPAAYRNELDSFKLEDRFRFTPYGNEKCDGLYKFFGKLKIDMTNGKNKKEQQNVHDIKDMFDEFKINVDNLEYNYKTLSEQRNFQGFYTYYNKFNHIQDKFREYTNEESGVYKNVYESPNQFANLIFKFPRGLLNFYSYLENKSNNEILKKVYFENFYGHEYENKDLENNFDIIYNLYNYIRNNNLELNEYISNEFNMDNVFFIDGTTKKVNIDFSNIEITSNESYFREFNISSELLIMKYISNSDLVKMNQGIKSEIIKVRLNDTQSSFIQFFYDLCVEFLNADYVKIVRNPNYSNVIVYCDYQKFFDVYMINLNCFTHYYLFQNIYQILVPIIIKDSKIKRNIRDRLKAFFIYALEIIKDYKLTQVVDLPKWKQLSEWYQESNIKNMNQKEYIISYYTGYNFNVIHRDIVFNNYQRRLFSILDYINTFEEIHDELINQYKHYIEKDNFMVMYSKYVPYLKSNLSYQNRIKEIKAILEDEKPTEINKNPLILRLKDVIYSFNTETSKLWIEISTILYKIDESLIKRIILKVRDEDMEIKEKMEKYSNLSRILTSRNGDYCKVLSDLCQLIIGLGADFQQERLKVEIEELKVRLKLDENLIDDKKSVTTVNKDVADFIDRLISEEFNSFRRLVNLIGNKSHGGKKVNLIKKIIADETYFDDSLLKLNEIINEYKYIEEDQKSKYYQKNVNSELGNILDIYFVNVLYREWRREIVLELKIREIKKFIKGIGDNRYKAFGKENKDIVNKIKETDITNDNEKGLLDKRVREFIEEPENKKLLVGEKDNE
ncbi:hypothetical protein [Clostridium felsineum]|uniref:hypothetical protein n=1 Tax=Clostridium felsineum TaxID=36839 RepID=UPI00098C85A5|nr:hypothetical protein [Clostridium felsineum]URZ15078.1 hypothetical protein CLFE_010950 [Clostridium felsineum DSM 794]